MIYKTIHYNNNNKFISYCEGVSISYSELPYTDSSSACINYTALPSSCSAHCFYYCYYDYNVGHISYTYQPHCLYTGRGL